MSLCEKISNWCKNRKLVRHAELASLILDIKNLYSDLRSMRSRYNVDPPGANIQWLTAQCAKMGGMSTLQHQHNNQISELTRSLESLHFRVQSCEENIKRLILNQSTNMYEHSLYKKPTKKAVKKKVAKKRKR